MVHRPLGPYFAHVWAGALSRDPSCGKEAFISLLTNVCLNITTQMSIRNLTGTCPYLPCFSARCFSVEAYLNLIAFKERYKLECLTLTQMILKITQSLVTKDKYK